MSRHVKIHKERNSRKGADKNREATETLREILSGNSKGNWEGGNQRVMRHS